MPPLVHTTTRASRSGHLEQLRNRDQRCWSCDCKVKEANKTGLDTYYQDYLYPHVVQKVVMVKYRQILSVTLDVNGNKVILNVAQIIQCINQKPYSKEGWASKQSSSSFYTNKVS